MLIVTIWSLLSSHWPSLLIGLIVVQALRNKHRNGLNKYPGHPLAAYSNWWRFFDVLGRQAEQTHIALHRKYGDVVRLGPNVLSFGNPRAIRTIYGLNKGMTKSDFYPIQSAIAEGVRLQSLFSTQDESYHSQYRRCVNGAFAMSSLVGYEPLVENTLDVFIEQTRARYAETGATCDFSRWLQFFAFDVIGDLTWSRRPGFVERNQDIDGIVDFVAAVMAYSAPVGQVPFIDLLWDKNPIKLKLQQWGWNRAVFPVTRFARERAAERAKGTDDRIDLLAKFKQAQKDHPDFMTDKQVLASCTSMILAGSETTAISLSSIFYHLIKHPRVYNKLMEELDDAVSSGVIGERRNNKVSWKESQGLPYLDAVIQESFRVHPAPGLILERVVPPQGMDICGEFIKGGTIVGCNPWVIHRNKEIFGEDVDYFRPERWLVAKTDRLREMKSAMFQFGAGSRTCIGKNISLLEIYKLVPTFLLNFSLEMEHEDLEWTTHNAWFVRQLGFRTRFKTRETENASGEA